MNKELDKLKQDAEKYMRKMIPTLAILRYLLKLGIRVVLFGIVLLIYLAQKDWLCEFIVHPFLDGISPLHILWLLFMVMMARHIIFPKNASMALRRKKEQQFDEVEGYERIQLLEYIQKQNLAAWIVLAVWLIFNGFWGFLYSLHIIDEADIFMITVFYFLSDYICILIYCPFQNYIMKNKCCINCRIYDWGHFMMFTPMLFIRNFFTWSLFFTGLLVLINWEIHLAKHPERFWEGSNKNLQCAHCKEKTCQIKRKTNAYINQKVLSHQNKLASKNV